MPNYTYIAQRPAGLSGAPSVGIGMNRAATNGVFSINDYFTDINGKAPGLVFYRWKWQQ
jgi:hypothetical protein